MYMPSDVPGMFTRCESTRKYEDGGELSQNPPVVDDPWDNPGWQVHWNVLSEKQAKKRRVVAVADIHGDLDQARRALYLMRIIDENDRWVGGNAKFYQTGDLIDRGPYSRRVLQLFLRLRETNPDNVALIMGNHEVLGVTDDELADNYNKLDVRTEWNKKAAKRRAAYALEGDLGRVIRKFPVIQIERPPDGAALVFSHGDIMPEIAEAGTVNSLVLDELSRLHDVRGYKNKVRPPLVVFGDDGPTTSREFSDPKRIPDEDERAAKLSASLAALKANVMIVGHTASYANRMEVSMKNRHFMLDLAMSRFQPIPSDGDLKLEAIERFVKVKRAVGGLEVRGWKARMIYNFVTPTTDEPVQEFAIPKK